MQLSSKSVDISADLKRLLAELTAKIEDQDQIIKLLIFENEELKGKGNQNGN